jgi:hypothetical protein
MAYTTRTVDWVITRAFLHAQRKATPPASGTTKYNALLAIVDSMQKLWADEPDIHWSSLYSWVQLPAVISATDTYALDTSIQYISKDFNDYIRVTNGTTTQKIKLVKPNNLYSRYTNTCYAAQIGRNLKFSKAFAATDSVIGYNIIVPSYTFPNDLAAGSDVVQVNNPMWLVYMVAAEFIRNDPVRQNQYQNLINLAENVMQKMKQDEAGSIDEVSRGIFVAGETWV